MLLDEDLPRKLKRALADHDIHTTPEMGWASIKNGALLALATAPDFHVFITGDRNIIHQQNVATRGVALIVLAVPNNKIDTILPLVPDILSALATDLQPGTAAVIGSWRVS